MYLLINSVPWRKALPYIALLVGLTALFWPARALRSDNFVFYFPGSRQILPLEVIENTKYLPLLRVLNLVGKVNGIQEKRNSLKVRFGDSQIECHEGGRKIRIDNKTTNLADPVYVSNGQWVVPIEFVTTVVPTLTPQVVSYRAGTNRIFIGGIKPASFSLRLDPVASGVRLTLQFSDKITLRTASENGKWVLFLGDRPIQPLEPSFHFQNPYVTDVFFDDQDGVPKVVITPSSEGLNFYPVLEEGGKVLLADVLNPSPPPVAQAPAAPSPPLIPSPGPSVVPSPSPPGVQPAPVLPVVVLDAGHGGEDTGTHSRDGVTEKELAVQLVARVRLALLATRKFRIVLTRTGDVNTTFEQRAVTANVAGAVYFITFHAGALGGGSPQIAVYTYQSPGVPPMMSVGEPRSIFIPWDVVQEEHQAQSRRLADALVQQFSQIPGVTTDEPAVVPVRTLRSVNAPAVAIEVGSLTPEESSNAVTDIFFQQQLANSVAQVLGSLEVEKPET